jgi:glycerate 2-kinase
MAVRERLRRDALDIFRAGVAAVDPYRAVSRCVRLDGDRLSVDAGQVAAISVDLGNFDRVVVVGAGKATARMAQALEDLLADRLDGGVIVVKRGHTAPLVRVEQVEASHPVPGADGVRGVGRLLALLADVDERSLVFALISGGGSALLPQPAPGIRLEDKQHLTRQLLAAGADIREINAVRKHISSVKGGQLARHAHPATVVSLVLSDVVGDPLDDIASGPTVPDRSTFADAAEVLRRRNLWAKAPASIRARLEAGLLGRCRETPKPGDSIFEKTAVALVGTNRRCLRACEERAKALGWNTRMLSDTVEGEASDVARQLAAHARSVAAGEGTIAAPACLLSGGEPTVTLRGGGQGGRNQQLALAAALALDGLERVAIASLGTDGNDGPTDAAGAIAFGDSVRRGRERGMDARRHLRDNDAYPFFDRLDDLVRTGPTGTNVMDVHVVLVADG